MKLFRYRRPSLSRVLGITTEKRRIKRALGISQVQAWTRPSRIKQRIKQRVGIYSPTMTTLRQTARGRIPTFMGIRLTRKR